jgi:hypothetical protein
MQNKVLAHLSEFNLFYIFSMLLWKIFKRISGNWRSMITGRKNWHVPFMLNSKIGYMVSYMF